MQEQDIEYKGNRICRNRKLNIQEQKLNKQEPETENIQEPEIEYTGTGNLIYKNRKCNPT